MSKQQVLANSKIKVLEDLLLQEVGIKIQQSTSQTEKLILELFESAILKKYKDSYDTQILHGEVMKETIDKCVDYFFADTCLKYRLLPGVDDATKDAEIEACRKELDSLKAMVSKMLSDRGVSIR